MTAADSRCDQCGRQIERDPVEVEVAVTPADASLTCSGCTRLDILGRPILLPVARKQPYPNGGYLFALDQVRNALRELQLLRDHGERVAGDPRGGSPEVAHAYLVDAERALEDAVTESPPPARESHGARRTGGAGLLGIRDHRHRTLRDELRAEAMATVEHLRSMMTKDGVPLIWRPDDGHVHRYAFTICLLCGSKEP